MEGDIEVDSEVGEGSTFSFTMKAYQAHEVIESEHQASKRKSKQEAKAKREKQKQQKKKVLTEIQEQSEQEE